MEKIDHENLDEPTHFLKIKSKLATYFLWKYWQQCIHSCIHMYLGIYMNWFPVTNGNDDHIFKYSTTYFFLI